MSNYSSMDNLYNFLIFTGLALVVAGVAVFYTLGRYRQMMESMQNQTDEYFKHAIQVVLKNQNKLTEIIVEEVRSKDSERANAIARKLRMNEDDQVVKFERKADRDRS